MKEFNYTKFNEKLYYEKLANGLDVYIIHKPGLNTSTCAFGTPYGALDIHQKNDQKLFDFHPGIAHFLEHKVFEDEDGDVMERFMQLGANVNAFTSYRETVYHFSLTGEKEFSKCLNLLLDFVQTFKLDETSVEKEKPIIIEEIKMYEQYPETRLLNAAMKAMYHHYPLKYDIGGDEESVNAISLKELEECYLYNYHPSCMTLVINSFIDPYKIIDIIKVNQNNKIFKPFNALSLNNKVEDIKVVREKVDLKMPVMINKSLVGFKLDYSSLSKEEIIKYDYSLRMALTTIFTSLNPDYQRWLDEGIINDYFGFEVDLNKDASYIIFFGENITSKRLYQLINDNLKVLNFETFKIDQLKRRYLGEMLALMDDPYNFTMFFTKSILDDINCFDVIDIINSIDVSYVIDVCKTVNYQNKVLVDLDNFDA